MCMFSWLLSWKQIRVYLPILEKANVPVIEGNVQFVQGVFQNQSERWQTEEKGEEDNYYIDDSMFVSDPQPTKPRIKVDNDVARAIAHLQRLLHTETSTSAVCGYLVGR